VVRRSGLGKGLGALIPSTSVISTGSMLREVPLARIRPNPFQPRNQFGEQGLSALVDSIKAVGILQPVLVREVGPEDYELIAGERRCRAARRAGLQSIPALVHQADDAMSLEEALVENLHREDLNPLDEAGAYQQLIEEFNRPTRRSLAGWADPGLGSQMRYGSSNCRRRSSGTCATVSSAQGTPEPC